MDTESTQCVQVRASVRDAGPMVPTGLRHWTHFFDGPLPQVQLDAQEGQPLYIHTYSLWCVQRERPTAMNVSLTLSLSLSYEASLTLPIA